MNKEQQELLNAVERHHLMEDAKILPNMSKEKMTELGYGLTQDEFINKCKTVIEFSQKWGLKIEERELSLEERSFIAGSNHNEVAQNIKMFVGVNEDHTLHKHLDDVNIPTKLITITYNNKTIENYEN
jgi:hypothetical protein